MSAVIVVNRFLLLKVCMRLMKGEDRLNVPGVAAGRLCYFIRRRMMEESDTRRENTMSEVNLTIGNFSICVSHRGYRPERLCDICLTAYREAVKLSDTVDKGVQ